MSRHKNPHSYSPVSFPNASYSTLSSVTAVHAAFTLLEPKVSLLWMSNLCFGPFEKKIKIVALSLVGSVSPRPFHLWTSCEQLSLALALCAWGPSLTFLRGKLRQPCHNLSPLPVWTVPSPPFLPVSSWFLPIPGQKSLFQEVFSCSFWMALPVFLFPVWFCDEVWENSTYSTAILWPRVVLLATSSPLVFKLFSAGCLLTRHLFLFQQQEAWELLSLQLEYDWYPNKTWAVLESLELLWAP